MPKFALAKGLDKRWHPADEESADAYRAWKRRTRRMEPGEIVWFEVGTRRDPIQHRRFMAMVRIAFRHWSDVGIGERVQYQGVEVMPDFDTFREQLLIMAGHCYPVFNIDGTAFQLKAKSISFKECEQDTFGGVYAAVQQVILNRVLTNYSDTDLERAIVAEIQRF